MIKRWLESLSLAAMVCLAGSCEEDADKVTVNGVEFKLCASDGDCPSGEGCQLDDDEDGYCTTRCSLDAECTLRFDCPGLESIEPWCDDLGEEASYLCDAFYDAYGPNTCEEAGGGGGNDSGGGCTSDSQCGACSRCSDGVCRYCGEGPYGCYC